MKAITSVNKTVSVPIVSLNGLWLAIAAVLRWVNRNYNDYELRGRMGEWTRDEARAEIVGGIANYDKRMREAFAWSDIWHEGGG